MRQEVLPTLVVTSILLVLTLVVPGAHASGTILYVSSYNNNSVLEYDGTTGAFIKTFVPS